MTGTLGRHWKLSEKTRNRQKEAQKRLTLQNPNRHKGENNPMFGKHHSDETKKLFSKQRKGKSNGHEGIIINEEGRKHMSIAQKQIYIKYPEKRNIMKERITKLLDEYPEKHANIILSKNKISYPHKELFKCIKELFSKYECIIEFPVKTNKTTRFLDIAIPSLKIDIEYDGERFHKDKEKDIKRDNELSEVGWKTIRFNKEELKNLKYNIFVASKEKEGRTVVVKYEEMKGGKTINGNKK